MSTAVLADGKWQVLKARHEEIEREREGLQRNKAALKEDIVLSAAAQIEVGGPDVV